jgi:uncharacterized protein YdeI (YjbR/CyaY-like superfamily)
MKKSIIYLLLAVFAAGVSVAEDKAPWWKFGLGGAEEEEVLEPQAEAPRGEGRRSDMRQQRRRPQMNPEQRAKVKAYYEEIHKLAEAARAEADPVKKEQLVDQLRAKLTEGAERMQAEFHKRLEQAEKDVVKMRERLEKSEANMSARVEEHLQKILSGEYPQHKGPGGGAGGRRKGPPPSE